MIGNINFKLQVVFMKHDDIIDGKRTSYKYLLSINILNECKENGTKDSQRSLNDMKHV